MCSVLPIALLREFVDLSKLDDDEIEELMDKRTVKNPKGHPSNAIVSCGDMHREDDDDVQNPFHVTGKGNPTNVIIPSEKTFLESKNRRLKRDAPPPDMELEATTVSGGWAPAPDLILGGPAGNLSDSRPNKKHSKQAKVNERIFRDFFNPGK